VGGRSSIGAITTLFKCFGDQVGDDFGVSFGCKFETPSFQRGSQFGKVFDHTVVSDRQKLLATQVRVSVIDRGGTMSGPASMTDASTGSAWRVGCDFLSQRRKS